MPPIRIEGLTKTCKDGPRAVDRVDLEIRDGEFMVLVGPSGCGKSTLLQMPAGIVEVTEGTIHIGERDVTRLDPRIVPAPAQLGDEEPLGPEGYRLEVHNGEARIEAEGDAGRFYAQQTLQRLPPGDVTIADRLASLGAA